MAQIVGVRPQEGTSKKTGRDYKAMIVSYVEPFGPQSKGFGHEAAQQFVDRAMFDAALEGRKIDEVLNGDCTFVFDRNGFLTAFVVD